MNKLSLYIVVALVLGGIVGVIFHALSGTELFGTPGNAAHSILFGSAGLLEILSFVGDAFVRLLKMLVVPLVFTSILTGSSQIGASSLGRVGGQTLGIYLVSTFVAIAIALTISTIVDPGQYINIESEDFSFSPKAAQPIRDVLLGIIPSNPVASLAEGNMLQIITFALILGAALSQFKSALSIRAQVAVLNDVLLKVVMWVIALAPIGVFCLITRVFAAEGFDIFQGLAAYFLTLVFALFLHFAITYSLILKYLAGVSPIHFLRKMKNNLLFAFSTSSSNATLPVTLKTVEQELGVNKSVSSFTVPLGATINLDGTAIMQGTATIFIATAYGIDLTFADLLLVMLTATLASIGTAGVPGAGLILLALVLEQAGLPVEAIGLVLGVDRLLDMTRTAVNVAGDATVSILVGRWNGQFDKTKFDQEPSLASDSDPKVN